MTTNLPKIELKNPIQGAGLTAPGVVILQFVFIGFWAMVEIFFRSNVGRTYWNCYLAFLLRWHQTWSPGTLYPAIVNPPIAFAVAIFFLMPTVGGSSLRISRIGVDLVTGLASVAPFLITGALLGWGFYITKKRQSSLTSAA
ncbi:MAG: hypothetical protein EBQ60_05270 [Actinobacteria bacterium]|nr:hypothetical protein [Actinomycetota bacterium]